MTQALTRRPGRLYWPTFLLAALVAGPVAAEAPEGPEPGEPAMSPVGTVPQALLLDFLADPTTFVLVDARSPEEYAASHIAGAVNVPHDQLDEYAEGLPDAHDGTVVVYCRSGKRAGRLQAQLVERGYTDVRVLQPEQIFSSGDLMVFNCASQASKVPAASEIAANDAREEE